MSVEQNLRAMERSREAYWRRYPATSPVKLRWRALTSATVSTSCRANQSRTRCRHGLWTEHLATTLRGENPITAAVFNDDFTRTPPAQSAEYEVPPRHRPQRPSAESFDYVVGTAILCHDLYAQNLAALYRLLKPGGQLLFFEANYWNPQVFLKNTIRPVGRWSGDAECQIGMRKFQLMKQASHQGFTHIEVIPYDIVHPLTPRRLIRFVNRPPSSSNTRLSSATSAHALHLAVKRATRVVAAQR